MIGIVSALLATFAYGLSVVLVKKRLAESNFISVSFIITVVGNIIVWPLVLLFVNFETIDLVSVLFFVIAGILAPGITRLLYFKGVEVIGVATTSSISATYPIHSSTLALLLLGEAVNTETWIGIICIIVGAVFIERSLGQPRNESKRILKKGLVFPLLASLTYALAFIARKHGLNIYNEPLLGVAIGNSLSFLLYLPLYILSHTKRYSSSLEKDFQLFWKAGALISIGWLLFFFALSHERVSIVASLTDIEPLFVLFFSCVYLKELEHISFRLVISTLLIVAGAVLVSVG